jgi:hypothetical protein
MRFWIMGAAMVIAMISTGLLLVLSYEPVKTYPMTGGWVATVTPDEVQRANAEDAARHLRKP